MNFRNKFLVSLPTITAGSFHKSVVYISEHTGDGAKGWILNKPINESTAASIRKSMNLDLNCPVYYGGPVDVNSACIVHSKDFNSNQSIHLNNFINFTKDRSIIDILNLGQCPEHWKLIIGYSGWGAGQLESEILGSRTNGNSSWISLNYDNNLMWNVSPTDQWDAAINSYAHETVTDMLKVTNT